MIFLNKDEHQSFLQAGNIVFTGHTQNSKFVISLQYLYEEGRDEVDFLHANRHQDVLHLMSLMLVGMIRPAQIPKVTSLHNLSNVSRKK